MVEPLRRVAVRPPDEAFGGADPAAWHYPSAPDLDAAKAEHADFVALLGDAEVIVIDEAVDSADAMYVHDPVLVTDRGSIVLRMGKEQRRGEEKVVAAALQHHGVPVLGTVAAPAVAEGGDLLWLDRATLAVGIGFRTNREGLRRIAELLPGVELIPVPLPYGQGPAACLHLMSLISVVDYDLAVVHRPLLPVEFVAALEGRGFRLIDVPAAELETHGANVLALAPGRCVMLRGNPVTAERLADAGCAVETYAGDQITLVGEGGATCLTRPVLRG